MGKTKTRKHVLIARLTVVRVFIFDSALRRAKFFRWLG